jgi:CheY-like chemotaxis protein
VGGQRVRVVVIDDDPHCRRGMVGFLEDDGRFDVVASLSHQEALQTSGWEQVDVVLVDAADTRRSDDVFPGVAVVTKIRQAPMHRQPTIVVMTGHYFDDAVRFRMREARADLFFHRTDLQEPSDLCEVLARPGAFERPVPALSDPEAAFRVGVTDHTKVNVAVEYAHNAGWLGGAITRRTKRSRTDDRKRRELRTRSHLNPVNSDGTPPDRNQVDPSRSQIARFLEWATQSRR